LRIDCLAFQGISIMGVFSFLFNSSGPLVRAQTAAAKWMSSLSWLKGNQPGKY